MTAKMIDQWLALPAVARYTAYAVAGIAFGLANLALAEQAQHLVTQLVSGLTGLVLR